jgi:hypothetical protein
MRHVLDGSRLVVHTEGISPYLLVAPEQTEDVLAELRSEGITAARDHTGVQVDGVVEEEIINFTRGEDTAKIQLVLDRADYGKARSGLAGLNLEISVRRRPWVVSIRRIDGRAAPDLAKLQGNLVSRAEIRDIIPGWQRLSWVDHTSTKNQSITESRADDPPNKIVLTYPANADAAEVKAGFLRDLAI